MKVSAVVISHGHAAELEHSLPALAPQVDELLVIANIPGSLPAVLPDGVRVLENELPLSFAANANLGAAQTEYELVLIANPDAGGTVGRRGPLSSDRAVLEVLEGSGLLHRSGTVTPDPLPVRYVAGEPVEP